MTDIRFELTDESKVNLFGVRVYRIRATEALRALGRATVARWKAEK